MREHTLLRFSGGLESTLGCWLDDSRRFVCFTLEDEHRAVKLAGETCIPAGRYRLRKFAADSDWNRRAAQAFPGIHRGYIVEIADVPGFTDLRIHWGNTDEATAGCVLVGETAEENVTKRGFIGRSRDAYRRWYPLVADDLDSGAEVWLNVVDYDSPVIR